MSKNEKAPAPTEAKNQQRDHTTDGRTTQAFQTGLDAIEAVVPVADDDPQQRAYFTAYELCRAFRRATGTTNEQYRFRPANKARIESVLEAYADRHGIDFEALANEWDIAWPVSHGPHRNPFEAAAERFRENPDRIVVATNTRRRHLNRAATFITYLSVESGNGLFYIPCRKLAEAIGTDRQTAARCIQWLLLNKIIAIKEKHTARRGTRYLLQTVTKIPDLVTSVTQNPLSVTSVTDNRQQINRQQKQTRNFSKNQKTNTPETRASLAAILAGMGDKK